jgi:hypothetical protein
MRIDVKTQNHVQPRIGSRRSRGSILDDED